MTPQLIGELMLGVPFALGLIFVVVMMFMDDWILALCVWGGVVWFCVATTLAVRGGF